MPWIRANIRGFDIISNFLSGEFYCMFVGLEYQVLPVATSCYYQIPRWYCVQFMCAPSYFYFLSSCRRHDITGYSTASVVSHRHLQKDIKYDCFQPVSSSTIIIWQNTDFCKPWVTSRFWNPFVLRRREPLHTVRVHAEWFEHELVGKYGLRLIFHRLNHSHGTIALRGSEVQPVRKLAYENTRSLHRHTWCRHFSSILPS